MRGVFDAVIRGVRGVEWEEALGGLERLTYRRIPGQVLKIREG